MPKPPWVIGPTFVIGLSHIMGLPPTGIGYRTIYLHLLSDLLSQLVIGLACSTSKAHYRTKRFISFFLAILYNISYHVGRKAGNKMNIETTLATIQNLIFSDIENTMMVAAGIAIIGAIIGIRRSLNHCSRTYMCGRRVL